MAYSAFDLNDTHDSGHGSDSETHQIPKNQRPGTPPPDIFADSGYGQCFMPYNEMESVDQRIYDLELEVHRLQRAITKEEESTISSELNRRKRQVSRDSNIHHYNWFGKAVYNPSSTPAEQSLAVIMSKPKILNMNENPRIYSLLNRAYLYIDPITIHPDASNYNALIGFLKELSNLAHAMKGHVFRYYTIHGSWQSDASLLHDRILLDVGDTNDYISNLGIGNGFTERSHITSWTQRRDTCMRNRVQGTQSRPGVKHRKSTWQRVPSPLSQVMLPATVAGSPIENSNNSNTSKNSKYHGEISSKAITRKPLPNSLTQLLVREADWDGATIAHSYYSFPFSEPRRRNGIMNAVQKASKAVLSNICCGDADDTD